MDEAASVRFLSDIMVPDGGGAAHIQHIGNRCVWPFSQHSDRTRPGSRANPQRDSRGLLRSRATPHEHIQKLSTSAACRLRRISGSGVAPDRVVALNWR
jgi:hypothetical protein